MSKQKDPATGAVSEDRAAPNPQFRRKKLVTLPLFKWEDERTRYYRFEEKMFKAKPVEGEEKDPPTLARVTDLVTGEAGEIIVNAVMETELRDAYPNDGYVGLSFELTMHAQQKGKKYKTCTIAEVEEI